MSSKRLTSDGHRSPGRRPDAPGSFGSLRLRRHSPAITSKKRLHALFIALVLVIGVCMGRAFQLQAFDSAAYAAKAAQQMDHTLTLDAQRGTITDRNGQVLATSEPAVTVYADPAMISNNGADPRITKKAWQQAAAQQAPTAIAQVLAKYLGGQPSDYLPRLTAKRPKSTAYSEYSIIKKQVPAWTYQQIAETLKAGATVQGHKVSWYGIYKEDAPIRVYPMGSVASNVVGFMNSEGRAQAGLELSLDQQLTGVAGRESYEASPYGKIPLGTSVLVNPINGSNYQLTIDTEMQMAAENALGQAVAKTAALSGTVVVMDIKSGEILALATSPGFDANHPEKANSLGDLGNRAISNAYEPGSVEKVLTFAALCDMGLMTPDTRVEIPSRLMSGSGVIRDAESHGTIHLTARGVLTESSNIGTVLLARQADKAKFAGYLKNFGLGQSTGIGLPGEAKGVIPDGSMPDYTRDQIAFGQGMTVNAVQMAAAISGIVNKGVYHQPVLLKSMTDSSGKTTQLDTVEPRRIVSPQASSMVVDMMESVITQGGKNRPIPNYRMAGKSGTAQRVENGRYSGYVGSFVTIAPVEDPRILVYTVLDKPINGYYGAQVALPVDQQLMKLALPRYGVVPSTTPARKEPITYQP